MHVCNKDKTQYHVFFKKQLLNLDTAVGRDYLRIADTYHRLLPQLLTRSYQKFKFRMLFSLNIRGLDHPSCHWI